ncbi:hypothetical protein [Pseudopedobacter sp.]|uniref:hypothetical protein n=1 Tax=Pseudopedobacter sp. TaxID=1936787 RepID=UPI00333E4918
MMKYLLSALLLVCFNLSFADHIIKKTNKNGKVEVFEKGDKVRISYPGGKLSPKSKKELKGISGRISEIKGNSFIIKSKHQKEIELNLNEVVALKKTGTFGYAAALIGTYAIIGGGVIYAGSEADLNPGITPLLGAVAIIPSALIATSIFYPANPRKTANKHYTLEIINQ